MPELQVFYATFGIAHPMGGFSIRILAESMKAARTLMFGIFGNNFMTVYPAEVYLADSKFFLKPLLSFKQRYFREAEDGIVRTDDFQLVDVLVQTMVVECEGGVIHHAFSPDAVDRDLRDDNRVNLIVVDFDCLECGDTPELIDAMQEVNCLEEANGGVPRYLDFVNNLQQMEDKE